MIENAHEYVLLKGWKCRESHKEITLHECPYCHASDWKFSINQTTGAFICNHQNSCGERGNLWKLQRDMGDITPVARPVRQRPKERPLSTDLGRFHDWYTKTRGIDQSTLLRYSVGLFVGDGGKKYMVFEIRNMAGELINRKFRNVKDKSDMWTEKNAEQGYYGAQFVKPEKKMLIVVEGEDDCHALSQVGITENVVSVPYGAMSYSPEMDELNSEFDSIILLFDNDEKGQAGAKRFAEKAGIHKCKNVLLPYKDSRDCVLNGYDIFKFQRLIMEAQAFKCELILNPSEMWEMWYQETFSPLKIITTNTKIYGINRILGGIRMGELTVVTGHSGQGKSTFAYNFGHWAEMAGLNVFCMSFENKIKNVAQKFIEIDSGESMAGYDVISGKYELTVTKEWAEENKSRFISRRIWHFDKDYSKDGYFTVETVVESINYAKKFYDCNFIIIDHLHYFLKLSDARNPHDKIAEAIRDLSLLSKKMNVHIVLICHPHKPDDRNGKLEKLTMNSGKGSSSIVQESDNYMIVGRNGTDNVSTVEIVKNRETGRLGTIAFDVASNGNTFTEKKDFAPVDDSDKSRRF